MSTVFIKAHWSSIEREERERDATVCVHMCDCVFSYTRRSNYLARKRGVRHKCRKGWREMLGKSEKKKKNSAINTLVCAWLVCLWSTKQDQALLFPCLIFQMNFLWNLYVCRYVYKNHGWFTSMWAAVSLMLRLYRKWIQKRWEWCT